MVLQKSFRTGRYLDGSARTFFVWCIYESESSYYALIEFKEDANEALVNSVFEFLNASQ